MADGWRSIRLRRALWPLENRLHALGAGFFWSPARLLRPRWRLLSATHPGLGYGRLVRGIDHRNFRGLRARNWICRIGSRQRRRIGRHVLGCGWFGSPGWRRRRRPGWIDVSGGRSVNHAGVAASLGQIHDGPRVSYVNCRLPASEQPAPADANQMTPSSSRMITMIRMIPRPPTGR